MKTKEGKRMIKLEFYFKKIAPFGHILKKNKFSFLCMVIPLGAHLIDT